MTNSEVSDKMMSDFNSANWDSWRSSIADNATMHDIATGQKEEGAEACMAYAQTWKTIYPDMTGTCNNRIESGNTLVEECTWVGTNTGEIPMPDGSKIPATGKSVTINNVLIWEFENGKMKSFRLYNDMMGLMGQLGLAG